MEKPEPLSIRGLTQAARLLRNSHRSNSSLFRGDGLKVGIKSTAGVFDLRCFKAAVF